MLNIKNIVRVLLAAVFVCALSAAAPAAAAEQPAAPDTSSVNNIYTDASFCNADNGIFSGLLQTGTKIFNRLRDLIYVVAGFGIIAVAVGGFFGNLNWKWLGAIVISLVVIASAGELIVLLTGCENYDDTMITNTLKDPTTMETMSTEDYNEIYTEENLGDSWIKWDDSMDVLSNSPSTEPEAGGGIGNRNP